MRKYGYYNEEQKLRYLCECKYEEPSKAVIQNLFKKCSRVEKHYKKDLSLFGDSEIVDLLQSFNSSSRTMLKVSCSYLGDYYNWCKEEGLVLDHENRYLSSYFTYHTINKIIPFEALNNKYFNEETALDYVNKIEDITNKCLFYLIYKGVKGEDYIELKQLKISDLNEKEKILHLCTGRDIKVDDLLINLIKRADGSMAYSEMYKKDAMKNVYFYANSKYVFKKMMRGDLEPISNAIILRRMVAIKEDIGNDLLSIPAIYKNGLAAYILNRFEEIKGERYSLEKILFEEKNKLKFKHTELVQQLMKEFGTSLDIRGFKNEFKHYLDCYK